MSRTPVKTIDQVEAELEKKPEDKREAPKEFVIERLPTGLYHIRLTAGGEVADKLKGAFTSAVRAQTAIDLFKTGRL